MVVLAPVSVAFASNLAALPTHTVIFCGWSILVLSVGTTGEVLQNDTNTPPAVLPLSITLMREKGLPSLEAIFIPTSFP